jgi:hypothetical protein
VGTSVYFPCKLFYVECAPAIVLKFSDLDDICPRQAEIVTGGISQVLTAAVVLVMVCPHEMAALQILIADR